MLDIRPITAADHAAWLPLWQGYQRFYNATIADETSALTWQRFLDPAEPMHAALAWRDGEAVGLVHYIYHRSCWTTGDYCYLQDLYVAENIRGGGIGRALIEHVYAEAAAIVFEHGALGLGESAVGEGDQREALEQGLFELGGVDGAEIRRGGLVVDARLKLLDERDLLGVGAVAVRHLAHRFSDRDRRTIAQLGQVAHDLTHRYLLGGPL